MSARTRHGRDLLETSGPRLPLALRRNPWDPVVDVRDTSTQDTELERALTALHSLHAEVDERAAELAVRHVGRLRCGRGCSACCIDDLSVLEIEAERIRRGHARLLASGTAGPSGACAFLDAEGACRIYADRPYVCRTQGLPLRWFSESPSGEIQEQRDICELNLDGPPIEGLDADDVWLIGPYEGRLAALQDGLDGGKSQRVSLRSLFSKDASSD
ncbi:MAG: YkgJ family cysteine cluster protein [Deltaproteobacteria bacterium]|nr:MAG: YkgJ family cysteine cluster protein [Deltaproteobacteria bacterium]